MHNEDGRTLYIGVAMMSAAMLLVPLVDTGSKYLSAEHSPLFISWARYMTAAVISLPLVALIRRGNPFPTRNFRMHALRTVLLVGAMTLYFFAITTTPLATAASAYFVGPIVAAALGVFLLGERFTVKVGLSVSLGFVGALVVAQPRLDGLELGVVLALFCGVLFGAYMVVTRMTAQRDDPLKTLVFQCVFGAALLTPFGLATFQMPDAQAMLIILGMGLVSLLSHALSITAFKYAAAAVLAPLVYLELISSAALGYVVFDEIPTQTTWLGAAIIVVAGLLVLGTSREKTPDKKPSRI